MGERLVSLYDFVKEKSGAKGMMRLAVMTMVPSKKAPEAEDTPETIARFRKAIRLITGEEAPEV